MYVDMCISTHQARAHRMKMRSTVSEDASVSSRRRRYTNVRMKAPRRKETAGTCRYESSWYSNMMVPASEVDGVDRRIDQTSHSTI